jgi:hypothetical protein
MPAADNTTHGLVVGLQAAMPNPAQDAAALRWFAAQLTEIAAQLATEAARWERTSDGEGRPIEKAYPVTGGHASYTFSKVYRSSRRLSTAPRLRKTTRRKSTKRTTATRSKGAKRTTATRSKGAKRTTATRSKTAR